MSPQCEASASNGERFKLFEFVERLKFNYNQHSSP